MSVELYGPLAAGTTITQDGYEQFVRELEILRRIDMNKFYQLMFKTLLNTVDVPDDSKTSTVNATRHGIVTDVMSSTSLITKTMELSALESLKMGQLPKTTYAENVLLRETVKGSPRETKIINAISALRGIESA